MELELKNTKYQDIFNKLYKQSYEIEGLKNIVLYLHDMNQKDTKAYQDYYQEYQLKFFEYELEKQQLSNLLAKDYPRMKTWHIDFTKKVINLEF